MPDKGTRQELLEVAIELFARRGFVGTSIRDIAGAAGRSVSNVYHYFDSKESLWLAILEHSINDMPAKLRARARGEGAPLERFKDVVRLHLQLSLRHLRESKIFLIDEDRLTPKGKDLNKQIQQEILDIYVEQMVVLRSHGIVQTDRLKIMALNVLSTLNWYLRWYDPSGELSADDVHTEIIDFVLFGSCGRPAIG